MNLPSRGLRPSATTMRKNGAFLAPTRFMRIRTGISVVHRGGRNRQFQPSTANVLPRSKQSLDALCRVDKSCFRFFSVNAPHAVEAWVADLKPAKFYHPHAAFQVRSLLN